MSGDLKWALSFLTILVIVCVVVANGVIGGVEGPTKGELAVKAAEGGAEEYRDAYAASRVFPRDLVYWIAVTVLAFVWGGFALKVSGFFVSKQKEQGDE